MFIIIIVIIIIVVVCCYYLSLLHCLLFKRSFVLKASLTTTSDLLELSSLDPLQHLMR